MKNGIDAPRCGRTYTFRRVKTLILPFAVSIALGISSLALYTRTTATQELNKNMPTLSGDQAVEYLKSDSTYGSLSDTLASIAAADLLNQPEAVVKLVASDGIPRGYFGSSVAISGDTLIVGAPNLPQGNGGTVPGAAYVFVRNGAAWTFQRKLTAPDTPANNGDAFGTSVSISGNTVIVGAPQQNFFTKQAGAAYVFFRTGTTWALQRKFEPQSTPTIEDTSDFGRSVAIYDETAVVGSYGLLVTSEDGEGLAHVFVRSGTTWTLQTTLTGPNNGSDNSFFARSLALSGENLIVGDPRNDIGATDIGAAHIFVRCGTAWTRQQTLQANDGAENDIFGSSVAISGGTVIVGAPQDTIGSNYAQGSAYMFVQNGTTWTQQQKVIASGADASSRFGTSVAILGDTVIVGRPQGEIATSANRGSAYVFVRNGTAWPLDERLTASDGQNGDQFGFSVAISSDSLIAGAPLDDFGTNQTQEGSAYVITLTTLPVSAFSQPSGGQCDTSIVVNISTDEPDFDLMDNLCDVDIMMAGKQCSLRAAIQNANTIAGTDIITFNIPGGGIQTISPVSSLPTITDKVTINGTSQPGYSISPVIELRGDSAGAASNGLVFAQGSGSSRVMALTINRFSDSGIVFNSNDNKLETSYIGLSADGISTDLTGRQQIGVKITGSRNQIGGSRSGTFGNNLITGNVSEQISITTPGAFENVIVGNGIGLIKTGLRDGTGLVTETGIYIANGASRNKIGGTTADDSNLIDDFGVSGIDILDDSNENSVTRNAISGCYLGIAIVGASNNVIGGAVGNQTQSSRNVIGENVIGIFVGDDEPAGLVRHVQTKTSGHNVNGQPQNTSAPSVTRTLDNKIHGNLIGLAANLTDFSNQTGIIVDKAERTLIGTGDFGFHNFISGNTFYGVWLQKDSAGSMVQGNFIGTDFDGVTIRPNQDGVVVSGSQNQLINNIISGNNDYGVSVYRENEGDPPPTGNLIHNNRIGTKGSGDIPIPNDESGILLDGTGNTITSNVISGNTRYGIDIRRDANTIRDNKIGTNTSGNAALANGEGGIFVSSSNNTISSNVISGNTGAGISIVRDASVQPVPPASNIIQNNRIGTNSDGSAAVPNTIAGIVLADGANNNLIGGTGANLGNVISGNGIYGINIQTGVAAGAVPPFLNKIQGNFIGTNAGGTAAIPNPTSGIFISGASRTLIGGFGTDIPAGRNIISGNGVDGISLNDGATLNRISGNYIGTQSDGTAPLGNVRNGIRVGTTTSGTIIGGPETNAGNTIGFNGRNGIALSSDAGNNNIIDPNRIFGNVLAGIDIGEDGFTPNDPADADVGPNKLQNYPTMTLSISGGNLIVNYQVDSAPAHSSYGSTGIYVEFFEADSTGAGRDFLGSDYYLLSDYNNGTPGTRVKNLGNAVALGIVVGDRLTATSTDAEGNSSEFAPAVNAPGGAPGFEGDVAPRPNGDGNLLSTDVTQLRRFVAGLDTPNAATNEVQRIDCAPRSTGGDGIINSTDVVQGRRFVAGLDPMTPSGGPARPSFMAKSFASDLSSFLFTREIRIGQSSVHAHNVSVPVEMISNGNETAMSFTIEYDPNLLSNPRVTLGKFAPSGSTLTVNTSEPGRIGVLIDSDNPMSASALARSLLVVTFDAIAGTETSISLTGSLAGQGFSDSSANSLPGTFFNGVVKIR